MTEEQARELMTPHMLQLTDARRSAVLREEHDYTPAEATVPGVEEMIAELYIADSVNMSRHWVYAPENLLEIATFFDWMHRRKPGLDFNLLAEVIHYYNNTSAVERLAEPGK